MATADEKLNPSTESVSCGQIWHLSIR